MQKRFIGCIKSEEQAVEILKGANSIKKEIFSSVMGMTALMQELKRNSLSRLIPAYEIMGLKAGDRITRSSKKADYVIEANEEGNRITVYTNPFKNEYRRDLLKLVKSEHHIVDLINNGYDNKEFLFGLVKSQEQAAGLIISGYLKVPLFELIKDSGTALGILETVDLSGLDSDSQKGIASISAFRKNLLDPHTLVSLSTGNSLNASLPLMGYAVANALKKSGRLRAANGVSRALERRLEDKNATNPGALQNLVEPLAGLIRDEFCGARQADAVGAFKKLLMALNRYGNGEALQAQALFVFAQEFAEPEAAKGRKPSGALNEEMFFGMLPLLKESRLLAPTRHLIASNCADWLEQNGPAYFMRQNSQKARSVEFVKMAKAIGAGISGMAPGEARERLAIMQAYFNCGQAGPVDNAKGKDKVLAKMASGIKRQTAGMPHGDTRQNLAVFGVYAECGMEGALNMLKNAGLGIKLYAK